MSASTSRRLKVLMSVVHSPAPSCGPRTSISCASSGNRNVATGAISYVREFRDMFQKIIRPVDDTGIDNTLIEPFEHLNVDYLGNFSTFSPELLGQRNDYYHNFVIGNLWRESLAQSLEVRAFQAPPPRCCSRGRALPQHLRLFWGLRRRLSRQQAL